MSLLFCFKHILFITVFESNKATCCVYTNYLLLTCTMSTFSYGECPSNSPFLKNNGAEVPKGPRPIVFKEWRDTRTFSNLKSTHCTLLILFNINLVTKKSLCIVSKVQSIKLFAPCGTLKVQKEQ